MQALYGYFTAMESLKEVSRNELEQMHALDPAKHDFADKAHFEARKREAVKLFNENYLNSEIQNTDGLDSEVVSNVNAEITDFRKKMLAESKAKRTEMLEDAERVYATYIKFLNLPMEIEHREKLDSEKKQQSTPFLGHPAIEKLKGWELLKKETGKNNISWSTEQDEIKDWYRKEVVTNEGLQGYFDGEEDVASLVLDLFKKVIFKSEPIITYLEAQNLRWSENQSIVKSMVLKTIKALQEEDNLELADLTKNGKEDFDFFKTLYDGVIKQNDYLDELIASKTKNWEVDRIAMTDRVILKLALVEMLDCPSIPKKVTINEAIEISKVYSTPKSKQFVNGVLDVLSNELTSAGKARKSGRGLIDNK